MILGIRAAILCEEVQIDEQGAHNYLRVVGPSISGGTRPSLVHTCVVLHLVVDGQPGRARITIAAPDFSEPFDFDVAGGISVTSVVMQLYVPIVREGELSVEVANVGQPGHPHKASWGLEFAENAEDFGPEKAAEALAFCRDRAEQHRQFAPEAPKPN